MAVSRWLEERGFSDLEVARGRTWISFSGTADQAETAFHVSMHRYLLRGEAHLANATEPSLPQAFRGLVIGISGLHDFRPHAHLRLRPAFNSTSSGLHYLSPDDWETIYDVKPLYSAGIDGTGVSIAVVGQSDVQLSDIAAFRAAAGLSANVPTVIKPNNNDPGFVSGDELESDLDLEWAGAIARNANITFITSGLGVQDSISYAVNHNVAPIIATSYGSCESTLPPFQINTEDNLYRQANAQGITIFASVGDDGATDCDFSTEPAARQGLVVDFPASSPFVTGVGGTTLNDATGNYWNLANNASNGSAISYIPEIVWNDAFQSATGGGASKSETKPSWQTGPGVPNDNNRDVPDIAFAASPSHDAYLVCGHNFCTSGFLNGLLAPQVVGGISVGPPVAAGMLALVIQKQGGSPLGNINPNLYSLAQISPNIFHDITSGNNKSPCQAGFTDCQNGGSIGYAATTGYDQTTGLGSLDVYAFANLLAENFQIAASPSSLTIQPGTSATSTITVTPQNNFNGAVTFSCSVSSGLMGVTCSVPTTAVNGSGTTTVTITAAANAWLLPRFQFPSWPPLIILGLLLILTVALALTLPKPRVLLYTGCSAAVFAIGLTAVSCGGGGATASLAAPVTTAKALSLSCTLPASSMLGVAYSGTCTTTGGTSPSHILRQRRLAACRSQPQCLHWSNHRHARCRHFQRLHHPGFR